MPYKVESIDKCNRFLSKFRASGWNLWQMQFRWNDLEGFHAWFMKAGEEDIELVTRNEEVQKAIVKYEK